MGLTIVQLQSRHFLLASEGSGMPPRWNCPGPAPLSVCRPHQAADAILKWCRLGNDSDLAVGHEACAVPPDKVGSRLQMRHRLLVLHRRLNSPFPSPLDDRDREGLGLLCRARCITQTNRVLDGERDRDGLREENAERRIAEVDRCRRRPLSVADSPEASFLAVTFLRSLPRRRLLPLWTSGSRGATCSSTVASSRLDVTSAITAFSFV